MSTIADAYVQIIPSTEGIKGKLEKAMNSEASSAGDKAGGTFGSKFGSAVGSGVATMAKGVAVATGAAVAGVTALTTAAVNAYADYEQLTGGVETLFGTQGMSLEEYANSVGTSVDEAKAKYQSLETAQSLVMNNASKAFMTSGLSMNEYMETATSSAAAMVSSLGGDTEKAAKLTDQAIVDMSDNANKMGTSMESIQNAYSGFAKGNFTMLDNLKLGYGGTKEEMERLLADAEAISGVKYDISSYADVTEAIHVMQEEMGIAGTTAKEATETISGSVGMVKASWTNLITGIADENANLDGLIGDFVNSISIAVENILPVINTALVGVGSLVEKLVPEIMNQIPTLINDVIPQLLQSGISIIQSILDGIQENSGELMNGAIEIITMLITSIVEMLPQLIEIGLQIITQLANGIAESLPTMIPTIVDVILQITTTLIEHIPEIIEAGLAIAQGLIDGLVEAIPMIVDALPELIDAILTALIDSADAILDGALTMFMAIVDAIPQIVNALATALPQIVSKVVSFLTGDGLPKVLNGAIQMLMAIIQAIPTILTALTSALPQIISAITDILISNAPEILMATLELLGGILEAIPQIVASLASAVPSIVTAITQPLTAGLSNLGSLALKWGGDLVNGFISGITGKLAPLRDKVKGLADTIKSYLHFSEPDIGPLSDFHTYAPDMMDLFMQGITDNEDKLNKTVSDAFDFKDAMIAPELKSLNPVAGNINTKMTNNSDLNGTTITVHERIDLGDTQLKDIVSSYVIQRIGNDTRAIRRSQGGQSYVF